MAINIFELEQQAIRESQLADQEREAQTARDELKAARSQDKKAIDKRTASVYRLATRANDTKTRLLNVLNRHLGIVKPRLDPVEMASRLIVVLLAVFAAFCMDYFWLGISTSFLMELDGIDPDSAYGRIAKVVMPLVVLALEMAIATLLYDAYSKSRLKGAALLWGTVAVALVTGLSIITASTLIEQSGVDTLGDMSLSELGLMIAYTILSMAPHLVILFSGKMGVLGKAQVVDLIRRLRLNRLNLKFDRRSLRAFAEFNRRDRDIADYNEKHPHPFREEVFPKIVRNIINEAAGVQVIQPPSGAPYEPDDDTRRDAPRPVSNPQPTNPNGESH